MFVNVLDKGHSQSTGIGLSLTVSNKIVNAMGGMMNVKSKENEGTVFTFTLPLDQLWKHSDSI